MGLELLSHLDATSIEKWRYQREVHGITLWQLRIHAMEMAHLQMIYLLRMEIFHSKLSNYQRVWYPRIVFSEIVKNRFRKAGIYGCPVDIPAK